jgi:hypothetical protein
MKRQFAIAALLLGALLGLGLLALRHARQNRTSGSARAKPAKALSSELERVDATKLFRAYAGGEANADPIYRGKRMTITGNVATVRIDAGVPAVILGSALEPVIATGVDEASAASLVPGAAIELDCTIVGKVVDMPNLDCGPHGVPRPLTPPP